MRERMRGSERLCSFLANSSHIVYYSRLATINSTWCLSTALCFYSVLQLKERHGLMDSVDRDGSVLVSGSGHFWLESGLALCAQATLSDCTSFLGQP